MKKSKKYVEASKKVEKNTLYTKEDAIKLVKETAITHADGHTSINRTTKVTGKGQIYFVVNRKHIEIPEE